MEDITFLIKEHIQYFMFLVLLNNLTGHKHYANVPVAGRTTSDRDSMCLGE